MYLSVTFDNDVAREVNVPAGAVLEIKDATGVLDSFALEDVFSLLLVHEDAPAPSETDADTGEKLGWPGA